jgi:hypothetical protein
VSSIVWFDSVGVGVLTNLKPVPGDRFTGWTPDVMPIGPSVVGLGTGVTHRYNFRRDDLVSFEIDKIPDTELSLVKRLKYHLMNGGEVQLDTDRALASEYGTCILAPDTVPQIDFSDRQNTEYTISLQLKGLGGAEDASIIYPAFVPGLKLWLKGDNETLAATKIDSDFVGGWYDDSGEGNDAIQATGSKQPRYYTNQVNGYPILRFDGVDDSLATPDIMVPTVSPGSVLFWVIRRSAGSPATRGAILSFDQNQAGTGNDEAVVYERSVSPGNLQWYSNTPYSAGSSYETFATGTANVWAIHALEFVSAATTYPYVNGTAGTPFGIYPQIESSIKDVLRLGRLENFTGSGDPPWAVQMDAAEIIWYEGILSAATRNGITRYLSQKYDIDVSV